MDLEKYMDWIVKTSLENIKNPYTNNFKKVLYDFEASEDSGGSYLYYHLNSDIDVEIARLIGLRTLVENLVDQKVISPETLRVGTPVLYRGESALFKGSHVESGKKFCDLSYVVGKNMGVTSSVPIKLFQEKASLAATIDKQKVGDIRDEIAQILELPSVGRTSNRRVIVFIDQVTFKKVQESQILINENYKKFGEIIPSVVVNRNGKENIFRGTGKAEQPIITVVTSIEALYIVLHQEQIKENRLYIMGTKWWKYGNNTDMESLMQQCKSRQVEVHVIANLAASFSKTSNYLLDSVDSVYTLIEDEQFVTNKIYIKSVRLSQNIAPYIEFEKYLKDILEDSDIGWLDLYRVLVKFRNTLYSSLSNRFGELQSAYSKLIETIKSYLFIGENEVDQLVINLQKMMRSDYAIALDRELSEYTQQTNSCLVVTDTLVRDTKENLLGRGKKAQVYGYSDNPDKVRLSEHANLVLINPRVQERRKWMYSGVSPTVIIFEPDWLVENLCESLFRDLRYLKKVYEVDDLTNEDQIPSIFGAIEHAIVGNERESKLPDFTQDDNAETENWDIYDEQDIDVMVNDSRDDEGEIQKYTNVQYKINFLEKDEAYLLGTLKGKVLTLQGDQKTGTLKHKRISDLIPGDKIAYFTERGFIKNYRNEFSKLCEEDFSQLDDSEKDVDLLDDLFWKKQFLNFCSSKSLNKFQLQRIFTEHGYKRSDYFYDSWSNIEKIQFVPHDLEFIRIVGIITETKSISENPSRYRLASQKVKERYQMKRQKVLNRIENEKVSEVSEPLNYITVKNKVNVNQRVTRAKVNIVVEKG